MIKSLCTLIFGSLFIGAVITPPLYSLIQSFWKTGIPPYSRVLDRVLMVLIFVFLLLLKKNFSVKEIWLKLRNVNFKIALRECLLSFFITLGISIILVFFIDFDGEIVWVEKSFEYYFFKILKVIFAAIIISILEEAFFRVVLLSAFKKKMNIIFAIVLSSLCYASVHFVAPDKMFIYNSWSLTVGFEYYLDVLQTMFFPGILKAFFGLFLVGCSLCIMMQRFSSIYINIGIHSGWVMAMKLFIYSTGEATNINLHKMARRYFLVCEPIGWISIICVLCVTYCVFKKINRTSSIEVK